MASPNPLKDAVALFDQNKVLAEMDPTVGDPRLSAGRYAHKHSALAAVAKAKADYKAALKDHTLFIVPSVEEGAELPLPPSVLVGAVTMSMFVVDVDDAYRALAKRAWESLGSRPGNIGSLQIHLIREEIDPIMEDHNIRAVTHFEIPAAQSYVSSFDDLTEKVKGFVRQWAGSLFEDLHVQNEVFSKAWVTRYDRAIVPVLVIGDTSTAKLSSLGEVVQEKFSVSSSEEEVTNALTRIAKEVIAKRNPQSTTSTQPKKSNKTSNQ